MPNGEIGDERITERRKYLPNDVIKMNKKIQEVTNIIEGKKTNGQVAQAVQAGYVMNPEIERYRVANPPIMILTNGTNIRMCKGCGKPITWNDKQYPHNMVFTRRGITRYLN